jgi:hypothetical protein
MTDYIAETTKVADQYLATVAQIQDRVVDAVEAFAKSLPELPQPAVELPTAGLPTAAQVNAAAFDFAEKALAQHRASTDKLIAVLTPAA